MDTMLHLLGVSSILSQTRPFMVIVVDDNVNSVCLKGGGGQRSLNDGPAPLPSSLGDSLQSVT